MKKMEFLLFSVLVLSFSKPTGVQNLIIQKFKIIEYNYIENCFPCDLIFEVGLGIEIKNKLDSLYSINKTEREIKNYLSNHNYSKYIKVLDLNKEQYLIICNNKMDSLFIYNSYLISKEGIFIFSPHDFLYDTK